MSEQETITDSKGRVIEVKKATRRELMRFMRQWGAACNVESWFALAILSASAKSIDGVPLPLPQTVDQVEMLAEKLGQEGTDAISEWYASQPTPDLGQMRQDAKN